MRAYWAVAVLVAAVVPVRHLPAQSSSGQGEQTPPVSAQGRLQITGCSGQTISDVVIITQPPYTDGLPKQLDFVRRWARDAHATTNTNVIRRYLLLKRGEPCNQIRRAESERILRAQPFLVDARIRVYDDNEGGVRLEVETRDEFSLVFNTRLNAKSPVVRGVRLGDANILGSARSAAVEWRDGLAYNDVWSVSATDYQFGRERNELRLLGARTERGQLLRAELVRPYYTDFQRFAYIGSVNGERNFREFRRPGEPRNSLGFARRSEVLGAIARSGRLGKLRLFGLSVTHVDERLDTVPVLVTREGFRADTGAPLFNNFRDRHVARLNGLFGVRFLRYVPVQGFDALTGTQDMPMGMQFHVVYGRALPIGTAQDRDRFFASNLYLGGGGPRSFVGAQVISEARNDRGSSTWDNHVASGRFAWYFRPAVRQLTLFSAEWSAGRDMRAPFQLSLADREGGILAHRRSEIPGAQRAVMRLEQRLVIPSRLNVADVGLAGFAEAGRLWGEPSVPYSQTTPVRGAIGVSLLAAVPPRSRRLWRLDVAMPLGSDPNKAFEIRISNHDRTRVFWKEPRDVESGRERTVPSTLFSWP